ncbi:unnamed protein product [Diatraea saccharalis]|uniref:MARVEL domain-containing protein n=1 Tax=Diatraea saccharalis TaxID=40085 RepID=A0A9N9QYR2_9NEOP|nr:unnamed protein product [Diatraea saccharalis]
MGLGNHVSSDNFLYRDSCLWMSFPSRSHRRQWDDTRGTVALRRALNAPVCELCRHTRSNIEVEFGGGARVVWAMSAGDRETEAQAKKGEEGAAPERDSRAAAALKQYWCLGLRAVELVIAVIAIGLIVGALYSPQVVERNIQHIAVIYSAYSKCNFTNIDIFDVYLSNNSITTGFIIITGVLIIARLLGETAGWRTNIGFSVIGAIMFTAAAAVIFYDWHRSYYANQRPNKQAYDLLIASGVFGIINAVVFLVHAFFTFRKEADY